MFIQTALKDRHKLNQTIEFAVILLAHSCLWVLKLSGPFYAVYRKRAKNRYYTINCNS